MILNHRQPHSVQGLPAFIGLTVPLAVSIFSAFSGDTGLLTATCLVPYLTTLFSQIWMEAHFVERGVLPINLSLFPYCHHNNSQVCIITRSHPARYVSMCIMTL